MEMHFEVGEHVATVFVSTSMENPRLAIALVSFGGPAPYMSQNETAIYQRLKAATLTAIAQEIKTWPLIVEPRIPIGWPTRAQRAQRAARSST